MGWGLGVAGCSELRALDVDVLRLECFTWRGAHDPEQEVMFAQIDPRGRMACRTFTPTKHVGIAIAGETPWHLLYHFRLPYSGFEYAEVVRGGERYATWWSSGQAGSIRLPWCWRWPRARRPWPPSRRRSGRFMPGPPARSTPIPPGGVGRWRGRVSSVHGRLASRPGGSTEAPPQEESFQGERLSASANLR